MKKSEGRLIVFIITVGLFFSACAPVTEAASTVAGNVSNAVGGVNTLSYQTTAWDVVVGLSKDAIKIQPSSAHTFMSADNIGDASLTLVATPVKGSAAISSFNAADAKEIHIDVNCIDKEGYVEITLSPRDAGDNMARETVAKVIAQLDSMFGRHTSS